MDTSKKIVALPSLKRAVSRFRKKGKKIAFTNGCFDLLHPGHIQYLEKAKKDNRILIIGLNSDRSVRSIKGKKRPINNQNDRASILAALECVDFVTIFNEDTPEKLIQAVLPDILIKGADYQGKKIAGSKAVKDKGGRLELIRFLPKYSTTMMIQKIKKL